MATAITSALCNIPIRHDVAMTGEITLLGRVLPIGGLKEKTMAAYRGGIKTVIIPADNASDLAEIDPVVKDKVRFETVDRIEQVLKIALTRMPAQRQASSAVPEPTRKQVLPPPASQVDRSAAIPQ
jgi:ATP-dependent Lon protease